MRGYLALSLSALKKHHNIIVITNLPSLYPSPRCHFRTHPRPSKFLLVKHEIWINESERSLAPEHVGGQCGFCKHIYFHPTTLQLSPGWVQREIVRIVDGRFFNTQTRPRRLSLRHGDFAANVVSQPVILMGRPFNAGHPWRALRIHHPAKVLQCSTAEANNFGKSAPISNVVLEVALFRSANIRVPPLKL
jgi:hypothetical protein